MIRKRKEGFWDRVSRWFLYKLVEYLKGIRNELFVIAENTKIRTIVENIRAYVHTITQAGYDGKIALTSWGGNSIVWNQHAKQIATGNYSANFINIDFVNGAIEGTITTSSPNANVYSTVQVVAGHKYLVETDVVLSESTESFKHNLCGNIPARHSVQSDVETTVKDIITVANVAYNEFYIYPSNEIALSVGASVTVSGVRIVDLTQYGADDITSVDDPRVAVIEAYALTNPEYNVGEVLSASVTDMVQKDTEQTTVDTKTVPAAVQALTGYGMATATMSNTVFWDDVNSKWWYYQNVGLDADTGLPIDLNEPVITDITELMADFDHVFTNVAAGDTLTFLNSNGDGFRLPVPATLEYNIKGGTPNA